MSVYEAYELVSLQDRIVISAKRSYTVHGEKTEQLNISRPDGEISVLNDLMPVIGIERYITQCYGVFGIVQLILGSYVIVITERDLVGEINEHKIWHIRKCEIMPIFKSFRGQNQRQSELNSRYLSMIHHVLSYSGFYYSATFDITHTTQKIFNNKANFSDQSLFNRADTRFLWNHYLMKSLIGTATSFCIPIMLGFISIKNCDVNGHLFKHILISRRSSQRVGVRYYTRGLDDEGNAANYVETEQIILMGNICHSYCQSRGSVPLIWSQDPNLKYKPIPIISGSSKHSESFVKHFAGQLNIYDSQYVVNLLDNRGREKILSQSFKDQIDRAGLDIKYTHFDFHKECSRLRWHNLSKLMDILYKYELEIGYFSAANNNNPKTLQKGIFRSNCIDCLDRTNVVQSMLARRALQRSLHSIGIINVDEQLEGKISFEAIFKNTWADNADMLAEQYTGTRALKTDYTRTGKRGFSGLLKDGLNSCIRYVYNNFQDGFRQDALDLFVGNYQPRFGEGLTEQSPLDTKFTYKQILAPIVLLCLTSLTFITLLIPTTNTSLQMAYILLWGLGVAVSSIYIINNGKHFVNKPTLMQRHAD